ncbi:SPOR domain-containing protein [Bacillus sp. FJAT-27264]|uniref:SPOR domain-containing protein n=1 Tax=Paenibacillus sp. (strain DSM 101736 / FJAT-27264) TaxID=1850362 RepID=UPI000AE2C90E|nr:SPOR domain-containing protein [Bacillus sp. FJAT-27264]
MNNGRMTFRFDVDKDKPWPKEEERRSSSSVGTAQEYKTEPLKQEDDFLDHGWVFEPEPLTIREPVSQPTYGYSSGMKDHRWQDVDKIEENNGTLQGRQTFFQGNTPPDLWDSRRPPSPFVEEEEGEWRSHKIPTRHGYDPVPEYYEDDGGKAGGGYGGAYHSRRPSYWWKFALSVAGALGTGLLLGYTALSFFGGGGPGAGGNAPVTGQAAVQNPNSDKVVDPAGVGTSGLPLAENGNPSVNTIPVHITPQSYYLLQYGVFSSPDGASQARKELLGAGLAAGVDPDDGNRVYAGLSPDREQAKLLSGGLKNQGIELYVREVTLPAVERLAYAGNAETVEGYFTASDKLLGELSSLSAALLSSGQVDTAGAAAVSDLHLQWKEAAKGLEQSLPPETQALCASLEKSMNQGISALAEYNKSKAGGLLWEVQGSMMDFLTGQKKLLAAMGASSS